MKTLILALALLSSTAFAETRTLYVSCSGYDRAGLTTVTTTGNFAGESYLNITNVGPFGIPFTQQARIEEATPVNGGLRMKLHTMLTSATVYLEVYVGGTAGLLSSYPGDQDGIKLACKAAAN